MVSLGLSQNAVLSCRQSRVTQIAPRQTGARSVFRARTCCSIPDYRAPGKYGLSSDYKPLQAEQPSKVGSAGPTPSPPPPRSEGYQSPVNYSAPADYSSPTAEVASVGGGGGGSKRGPGGGGGGSGGNDGKGGGKNYLMLRLLTTLLAIAVAGSGVYAYLRSGSRPSAIASGTIAAALLLSVAFMAGRTRIPATLLALAATLLLGTHMGKGYQKTRRPFPQGVFALASAFLGCGYIISMA